MRIDKFLWAVRIFKTRALASESCRNGHVRIGDDAVKASREVRLDDVILVHHNGINKTIKVLNLLEQRVSAPKVPDYILDLTPEEEYERARLANSPKQFEYRGRGLGRPTKRDRREIDGFKGD